ncbi:MAG: 50S ribosomal protein L25 [Acholeplasmataceae bacterium]|nr:50S ribosomal protein L25 [Acholeplasmataceae bacterium]
MKIEKRTANLQTVRKMKKLPGVIYGKSISPVSIQIDERDFRDLYKTYGKTKAFKVKLDKDTHQVFIKDVQADILNPKAILSFDLLKVEHGNLIKNRVPIRVHGREAIEKLNGIVQITLDEIEVEYSVDSGIDAIDIDVSSMEIGQAIHVRDLVLPAGIKAIEDENRLVINVLEVKHVVEEETETEEEEEESEAPASE